MVGIFSFLWKGGGVKMNNGIPASETNQNVGLFVIGGWWVGWLGRPKESKPYSNEE